MKLKLIAVAAFSTLISLAPYGPALAETAYPQSQASYLAALDSYRTSQQAFQTAKQKYLDYKTLTSQTSAISAGKSYLTSCINLVVSYLDILMEKTRASSVLSSSEKDYITDYYVKDRAYFNRSLQSISTLTTIEELEAISTDLNTHLTTETLPEIPLIRNIIAISDYRRFLEDLQSSLKNVTILFNNQDFLGTPTHDLINTWLAETNDKILSSSNLLNAATTEVRNIREGNGGPDVPHRLDKSNETLRTLQVSLIYNANSLLEILARLING